MTPKEFIKRISYVRRDQHPSQNFGDFVDLAFHTLAKASWMGWGQAQDAEKPAYHEAEYMRIVERYRARDQLDVLRNEIPQLMAAVMVEVGKGHCDYLGAIASELEALNAHAGQFFTPYDVCRMMAEITLGDAEAMVRERGFITVSEPSAGAGAMVLAAADLLESKGLPVTTSMFVEARDLSDLAFKMCFIQLQARGVAAHVVRGNTLSGKREEYEMEVVPTLGTLAFFARHGHPFADQVAEAGKMTPAPQTVRALPPAGTQFTFDLGDAA